MNVLGIDPGLDGAISMWDGKGLVVYRIPAIKAQGRGREVQWEVLNLAWHEHFWEADHAFIERVMSRHGEGVSSAFKFGFVAGGLRGMIAAKQIPCTQVTPGVWKKWYGIQASKSGAVRRACELFPSNADQFTGPRGGMKDGEAESALIAKYGYDKLMKEAV